jgi:putative flippase GtrA
LITSRSTPTVIAAFFSWQFIRFTIVGGIAAFLHWGSRIIFNYFVSYPTALVLAYGIGIITALILNKVYVFPLSSKSLRWEIFFFVIVNLIAFPFVWSIAYVLSEFLFPEIGFYFYPRAVAHGIAIFFPLFINFLAHKYVTFRGA